MYNDETRLALIEVREELKKRIINKLIEQWSDFNPDTNVSAKLNYINDIKTILIEQTDTIKNTLINGVNIYDRRDSLILVYMYILNIVESYLNIFCNCKISECNVHSVINVINWYLSIMTPCDKNKCFADEFKWYIESSYGEILRIFISAMSVILFNEKAFNTEEYVISYKRSNKKIELVILDHDIINLSNMKEVLSELGLSDIEIRDDTYKFKKENDSKGSDDTCCEIRYEPLNLNDFMITYGIKRMDGRKLESFHNVGYLLSKDKSDLLSSNDISKEDLVLRIKELTKEITGSTVPSNTDLPKLMVDIFAKITFGKLINLRYDILKDNNHVKRYQLPLKHYTYDLVSTLGNYIGDLDYGILSRVYNILYEIKTNKVTTAIDISCILGGLSWIALLLQYISEGLETLEPFESMVINFSHDSIVVEIEVDSADNIGCINRLLYSNKNINNCAFRYIILEDKKYFY